MRVLEHAAPLAAFEPCEPGEERHLSGGTRERVDGEFLRQLEGRVGDDVLGGSLVVQQEIDVGRAVAAIDQVGRDDRMAGVLKDFAYGPVAAGGLPDGPLKLDRLQKTARGLRRRRVEV